ncbi:MAG: Fe-S cluster assembly protein SufD [Ilumatobacteraceae bacterium]
MSPSTALLERLVPVDSPTPQQPDAAAWLKANGLPTRHDESWKYTPLDRILAITFERQLPAAGTLPDRATIDTSSGNHGGPRIVFVNGAFVAALSDIDVLPDGVECSAESDSATIVSDPAARPDGFQALNRVAGNDGAIVRIAEHVVVTAPIHIVHFAATSTTSVAVHPRTTILVGRGSRATVIESFVGTAGEHLTNAVTTIDLATDCTLTHHRIQSEGIGAVHIGATNVVQHAGSSYYGSSFSTGSEIARNAADVVLAGPGADTRLSGMYLPRGSQLHDNIVTVEHRASRCTSNQLFKAVVDDRARGSFSGRILVQPNTVGTDSHQTSRSLVLEPTAQADTRPWLEILADDVVCTHGATIGQLDEEALFYLRTRGVSAELARSMLVEAFIGELIDAVETPSLRAHLESEVTTHLAGRYAGHTTDRDAADEDDDIAPAELRSTP